MSDKEQYTHIYYPRATSDGDFKPGFKKIGVIADGACPRAQLHFMDLDGDGLKDYACVDPKTGATTVHINIPGSDGKTSGNWKKLGEIATGAKGRDGTGVLFAEYALTLLCPPDLLTNRYIV